MFLEATTIQALLIVGAAGAIGGLVGGFLAGADNLIGTILMGVIGGISLSAILLVAGVPPIVTTVGADEFSLLWGAVGGLVLGFVVGRSNV